MRTILLTFSGVAALLAWIDSSDAPPARCRLSLELVDQATGATMPGLVQIRDGEGDFLELPELLDRGLGLAEGPIHDWRVLPRRSTISVPQTKLSIRAFSGLETEFAEMEIDLSSKDKHAL